MRIMHSNYRRNRNRRIFASTSNFSLEEALQIAKSTIDDNVGSTGKIMNANRDIPERHFTIFEYDVGNFYVLEEPIGVGIYHSDGRNSQECRDASSFRSFIRRLNANYWQRKDEYEGRYSLNASTRIRHRPVRASEDFFCDDPKYLRTLVNKIESCLYTDFDIDAQCWSDGACIHITCCIDDEDSEEYLITENDLVSLTGDLEADAYTLAEEFYTSI